MARFGNINGVIVEMTPEEEIEFETNLPQLPAQEEIKLPKIIAQARLKFENGEVTAINGAMTGIAAATPITDGITFVQFTTEQSSNDYLVNAFDGGLYRCYVLEGDQYSDGFIVMSTDTAGTLMFPTCVQLIIMGN